MKIFFLLLLFSVTSPLLFAKSIILCADDSICTCQEKVRLPVKRDFFLKDMSPREKIYVCKDVAKNIENTLERPLPEVCADIDVEHSLFEQLSESAPKDCGYVLKKFNAKAFRETVANFIKTGKILCGGLHHSMCTSAVFLALLSELKKKVERGELSEEKLNEWADLKGPVWAYLNDQARPDLLMNELNLGTGKTLRQREIPDKEWPKEGDIVQIWRKDNSGHSTVFAGHLKDSTGKIIGLCFWSSNLGTNGYGEACEKLENVDRIVVGRLK